MGILPDRNIYVRMLTELDLTYLLSILS